MVKLSLPLIFILHGFLLNSESHAQTNGPTKIKGTTQYFNSYDRDLTFEKMTYLPSQDNVNGVYQKIMDNKLKELIEGNHQWNFVENGIRSSVTLGEELVDRPSLVKSFSKNLRADGFFMAQLRKDPKEIKIRLYLFSTRSGELILEEELSSSQDTTEIVERTLKDLFGKILEKIPYDAFILSRTGSRVTINAGRKDGVRVGQKLNAVQLIGAEKHPKRKFIVNSRKALLGQLQVVKVDDYLSFADILTETESGVLTKGMKVTGLSKKEYGANFWSQKNTPPGELLTQDNKFIYGKNPKEWLEHELPTFGKIGADFSLGSFYHSMGFQDDSKSQSQLPFYPRINLTGELWITSRIYAEAFFAQGQGSSEDPEGSHFSHSLTQYRLSLGYHFLLKKDFFGPKLTVNLGFSSYKMFVDDSNTKGLTTVLYQSLPLGVGGHLPINASKTWAIGGRVYFHLFPDLVETPQASGNSPSNTINQFNVYAENRLSEKLSWRMGLEQLLLSTSFSSGERGPRPASTISQSLTMFSTGFEYWF